MAVTDTPVTGSEVESDKTLKKIPAGWPLMTQVVEGFAVAVIVELLKEVVTVTDLGDEYWYAFKPRETTTMTSRTAMMSEGDPCLTVHLLVTGNLFLLWRTARRNEF
jgi:hypothetical protein